MFSELRVRLAPLNQFKPSSKIFHWPFQGGTSLVDLLCFFCIVFAMWASVYMCLVVTCWERADLLAHDCGVQLWVCCYFPIGILGQVWYLIVSIPDLCTLTYFNQYWAEDKVSSSRMQCLWWGSNRRQLDLKSSTLPLSHCDLRSLVLIHNYPCISWMPGIYVN